MRERTIYFAALALAFAGPAHAQRADAPEPALAATPIPSPVNTPWPGGTMTLDVDASDVARGVYRVTQTIPVASGTRRLTLLFPEWLPGNHAPRGPIAELVGLEFSAGRQALRWERDRVDVNAFHIDLAGASGPVVARFVHTSPLRSSEGRVTMTAEMLNLQWEKMSLYPAGHDVSRIAVTPSVTLPTGWNVASALSGRSRKGDTVAWASTDYATLVDSPVFAGIFFRQWPLGKAVQLSAFADAPSLLSLRDSDREALSKMVDEAVIVFGTPPYDRYEFLVALTARLGEIGLELPDRYRNGPCGRQSSLCLGGQLPYHRYAPDGSAIRGAALLLIEDHGEPELRQHRVLGLCQQAEPLTGAPVVLDGPNLDAERLLESTR